MTTPDMNDLCTRAFFAEARSKVTDTIYPLNMGGTKIPLFWVSALAGCATDAIRLSQNLGPGQPLHAVCVPTRYRKSEFARSVPDIAARNVVALNQQYPDGPVLLGAWSSGTVIMLEMAQQLKASGREIANLVAVDFAPTQASDRTRFGAFAHQTASWLYNEYAEAERPSIRLLARAALAKAVQVTRTKVENGHPADRWLKGPAFSNPEYRRFTQTLYDTVLAYVPAPYDGRILLVTANPHGREKVLGIRNPGAAGMEAGWKSLGAKVRTIPIAGDHRSIMMGKEVEGLATAIRQGLAATDPALRGVLPRNAVHEPRILQVS